LKRGADLETKRSFKGKFFSWLRDRSESKPEWRFLIPYEKEIERHDQSLRTPEYHKHSVIRGHITGASTPEPNDLLQLVNRLQNAIWPNLLNIVSGQKPAAFTDLHRPEDDEFGIDPYYLE
jgi:hypothetical protein